MKNHYVLISFLFLTILSSCQKDQQTNYNYDCYVRLTIYKAPYGKWGTETTYYKNDRAVKVVFSMKGYEDYIGEWEYDVNGNIIREIKGVVKNEYEYNSFNKVIKAKYYTFDQLDYCELTNYQDTLIKSVYQINSTNDTLCWSLYYYNSENRKDSIKRFRNDEFDISDEYYFYSPAIDSVIMKDGKIIRERHFYKYSNGRKVYDEFRENSSFGNEVKYIICTWEYDNNQLLTRETKYDSQPIGLQDHWTDSRYFYDESNKLVKTEEYLSNNQLLAYTNYFYENGILVKKESYNINNTLISKEVIENKCNR